MSDDLVKRLRIRADRMATIDSETCHEAADRIEELNEQLEAARHDADEAEAYAWQLEQRLAELKRGESEMTVSMIVVTDVQEHEDGSATYTFDLDKNSSKKITEIGLQFILTCAAYGLDIQEALKVIADYGKVFVNENS